MAEKDESYDKARNVTERALDAYVKGDGSKGDRLVDQAKAKNEQAVKDVAQELEEDAGSQHDPSKIKERD